MNTDNKLLKAGRRICGEKVVNRKTKTKNKGAISNTFNNKENKRHNEENYFKVKYFCVNKNTKNKSFISFSMFKFISFPRGQKRHRY